MVKYVRFKNGAVMYVLTMFRTERGNWKVEVSVCDCCGTPVSDPVAWDIFPSWLGAYKYMRKQYKEFDRYVNRN